MVKNLCTSRLLLTQIFHSSYFYHYPFLFSLFVFTISFAIIISKYVCVHPQGLLTHYLKMCSLCLLTQIVHTDFILFLAERQASHTTLQGEKSWSRISNNIKHENYSDLCCGFVKISKIFQFCGAPGGFPAGQVPAISFNEAQKFFRDTLSSVQN